MSEKLAAALLAVADADNRSLSDLIREILEDWLLQNFPPAAVSRKIDELREQREAALAHLEEMIARAREETAASATNVPAAVGSGKQNSVGSGKQNNVGSAKQNNVGSANQNNVGSAKPDNSSGRDSVRPSPGQSDGDEQE